MSLNIKIENFEGPFDLLLHLIKKNEMDIYDIKIYDITNQYLNYINNMREIDLDVTSEFIVIAATLLEIKSKMLLPKSNIVSEEEEEDDPRKELVSKLLEYKSFKQAANFLSKLEKKSKIMFSKKPEIIEDENSNKDMKDLLKDITILKLFEIYNNLINNYNEKINKDDSLQRKIPIDKFKIEDKIVELTNRLYINKRIIFSDVMNKCENKTEMIVTFLALLELIKLRMVNVIQENNFNEIYVEGTNTNGRK